MTAEAANRCRRQRSPLRALAGARARICRVVVVLLALILVFSPLLAMVARADSYDERRVRTGARLFRSLLAADTGLEQKLDKRGELLLLVYSTDPRLGQSVTGLLQPQTDPSRGAIRGLKLRIETITTLPAPGDSRRPVGLFLASAPSATQISAVVQWSVASKVIVFSPFDGHVEQGITAGLAIEAKVQPFLNQRSLDAMGLALKPFFLKVAKVHR